MLALVVPKMGINYLLTNENHFGHVQNSAGFVAG